MKTKAFSCRDRIPIHRGPKRGGAARLASVAMGLLLTAGELAGAGDLEDLAKKHEGHIRPSHRG